MVVGEHKAIPTFALIMLGAIYGLQVIIFVLHRKFEHIGWMLVYILGIPFFSFILPLVSFWGSTREIVGEQGKRLLVHDEGKFDPASIPLRTWSSFEADLWVRPHSPALGLYLSSNMTDARPSSCAGDGLERVDRRDHRGVEAGARAVAVRHALRRAVAVRRRLDARLFAAASRRRGGPLRGAVGRLAPARRGRKRVRRLGVPGVGQPVRAAGRHELVRQRGQA